jgi:NADH-quinone oxidoreductase subunit M
MVYCTIFWELALIPIYFIALIWGNGDAEGAKAVIKFFIYIAGSLFMLIAFVYLYQKAGSFLIQDLYDLDLTRTEQFWIFWAFSWLMQLNSINSFLTWQLSLPKRLLLERCCVGDYVKDGIV